MGRVLRLGDIEDEERYSANNEGRGKKGGTTNTPSTGKCDKEGQEEVGDGHGGKEK